MLSVNIICVGKLKDKFFKEAADEYIKRLKGYCKMEITEIPQTTLPENPSDAQIKAALVKEGQLILKSIKKASYTAAMCVEGKLYSSEDMAEFIQAGALKGGSVTFIIGGSCGLADEVKNAADVKMSVSKMTFPHRLFRVMLLEQIYRGFKINAGEKYHK